MTHTKTLPIYDSSQKGHPALEELREAFRYRYLIQQIIRRDILARYKRSVLGVAWTMFNPLGTMVVMVIVFSTIFGRNDPGYPAYVLSGLLAWNFFSETTNTTMRNLVWGGGLLGHIYFPRTSFALSSAGTAIVNLTLSMVPLLVVMLFIRAPIRASILFLPVPALFLLLFSLGFGLLLSISAVYFPDVVEMYQIVLRAWMYLTPIIYPEHLLPDVVLQWIRILNPMYHLINFFRIPVHVGRIPTLIEAWPAVLISLLTVIVGWLIFTRRSDEFAYRV